MSLGTEIIDDFWKNYGAQKPSITLSTCAIRAEKINISFDKVHILKDVDFSLREGEVHAIVGSNGAGKSTLMKILNGVYKNDSGKFSIFGKSVDFDSPEMARQEGIAMVYQDLSLIPTLTVAENIFLRSMPYRRGAFLDDKTANQKAHELLQLVGVGTDALPTERVENVSAGQQQIIEILKALSETPRILILDEPTASLTYGEIENLFSVIHKLKEIGISIVYITHYLQDIFKICDSVTVLNDGVSVLSDSVKNLTLEKIINSMVGSKSTQITWSHKENLRTDTPLLDIRNLSTAHVHDVSLQSYPGEIVGIAGLLGSGRTELMNAIFGIDKHIEGKILIAGEEKKISSTKQAINAGVTLVPENRREQGLVLDFKVSTNIVMSILEKLKRLLFMDRSKESTLSMSYIDSMNIKTQGIQQIVRFLSGGNQQKIVVAKCLATNSSILLLDDPTFGVDIHAKYEIMKIIKDFADQGNTVLFISSEFKEIVEFCDSIYVMKRGEISQFISDQISEGKLLQVVQ